MNLNHLIAAVMNAAAAKLHPMQPHALTPMAQWLGQHKNPLRAERRRCLRAFGRRQFKKQRMHLQFPARPAKES